MNPTILLCALCVLLFNFSDSARAQGRSSTNYSIDSEAFTSGHLRGTSTAYEHDASTDIPYSGLSQGGPGNLYRARHGHIAQLTDPVSFNLAAASDPEDEESANLLSSSYLNDDATLTAVPGASILWSIVSGPITGIDANGLATLDAVYQDEVAIAQATLGTFSDQVTFTVANSVPDNLGAYSGDGLEDGWQVGFFGDPPNADASPSADPDRDGRNNTYENLSGFSPIDSGDFFQFTPLGFSAATTLDLNLNKVIPGTKYTVLRSPTLTDPWTNIGVLTPGGTVIDQLFQDPSAGANLNFYRVVLEKN